MSMTTLWSSSTAWAFVVSSAASQFVAMTTRSAAPAASAFVAARERGDPGPPALAELVDDRLGPGPLTRAGEHVMAGRGEPRRESLPGRPGGPQHPDLHAAQHGTARPARRPSARTLGR